MKKAYILALDQGTTGSRAFVFDGSGRSIASAYKEFKQYYPKPGWVEHDADEIWRSVVYVIAAAIKKAEIFPSAISTIGITNQRETTVLWDRKTSKPVAKAIVWQCRRTSDICHRLKAQKREAIFRNKTGLVLDPYFSGTKIKWLLDHVKGLRKKAARHQICFGTIDSWLIWKLTRGTSHVTDMTNASRTLIFNIKTKSWDKDLLKILNIPRSILPEVKTSGADFGKTVKGSSVLPAGIKINAVLGDQQAALYGQGCHAAGQIKNTYGTGCFMVLNTGNRLICSQNGLLTTLASDATGKSVYALEGAIFIAGAVIQWLRDELRVIKTSPESEKIITGLKDTHGVYLVPAFAGLGAPYWDSEARGIICGLTRGANVKHVVRAALESMAYQTKDVFLLMEKALGKRVHELKVDGGACKNNFLMQFQADVLGRKIVRPKVIESTVWGVAALAGITARVIKNKESLKRFMKKDKVFKPTMKQSQQKTLYAGWQKAVRMAQVK